MSHRYTIRADVHLNIGGAAGYAGMQLLAGLLLALLALDCRADTKDSARVSQTQLPGALASMPAVAPIDSQVRQAVLQWKNCAVRQAFQNPTYYGMLSITKLFLLDSTIEKILTCRCTTAAARQLRLGRKSLYTIAGSTPRGIKKPPSEKAPGSSLFADSTVLFLLPETRLGSVYEGRIGLSSDKSFPLQDWFTCLSGSDPSIRIYGENLRKEFSVRYKNPVSIRLLLENMKIHSDTVSQINWNFYGYNTIIVTPMDAELHGKGFRGLIFSNDSIAQDNYTLSQIDDYSWEADLNRDSIPDVRAITYPKQESEETSFNIFAQVNIRGNWVTTDYHAIDLNRGY